MNYETHFGKEWSYLEGGGDSELEMGTFLYGMVRMLKPDLVVETGCYKGGATHMMGLAVQDNGFGRVVTCENHYPNPFTDTQLRSITWRNINSLDLPELREADFVFSDSHEDVRPLEFELVKPGCVFVIHDTAQPYRDIQPPILGAWAKSRGGLCFNAGRGFALLIKD